jgi:Lar family restriction alleviation protein
MTGPNLLPCPFCGAKAKLIVHRIAEDEMGAYVLCKGCGIQGQHFEDAFAPHGDAIAAWNTRAPDARVAALVESANNTLRGIIALNLIVGTDAPVNVSQALTSIGEELATALELFKKT